MVLVSREAKTPGEIGYEIQKNALGVNFWYRITAVWEDKLVVLLPYARPDTSQ
jgi:hypothetical protein